MNTLALLVKSARVEQEKRREQAHRLSRVTVMSPADIEIALAAAGFEVDDASFLVAHEQMSGLDRPRALDAVQWLQWARAGEDLEDLVGVYTRPGRGRPK